MSFVTGKAGRENDRCTCWGRVFGEFEEPNHDGSGCINVKVDCFDNDGMCSRELDTVGKHWGFVDSVDIRCKIYKSGSSSGYSVKELKERLTDDIIKSLDKNRMLCEVVHKNSPQVTIFDCSLSFCGAE